MPYSITTKDGITIDNIPETVAPDSPELKDRVAKIRAGAGAQVAAPEPAGNWLGRQLGLTARHGIEGVSAAAGMVTDPVISAIGGAVRMATGSDYDPDTLASIGRNVADALGLPQPANSEERMVGALTRGVAGGGAGALAAKGISAATSGATQQVAQNMAAQPALQAVSGGAAGLAGQMAAESGAGPGGQLAAALAGGLGGAAVAGAGARAIQAAKPQPPAPPVRPSTTALPADELAALARKAAESGVGSKAATRLLAEQAMPDQKVVDAAKRLGIAEYLQPDHVTTNQAYRELAQAVKSVPGSTTRAAELEGLEAVARRADKLVDEFGGSADLSRLDAGIKSRMQTTQEELTKKAEKLYGEVAAVVPPASTADASNTLGFLTRHAAELGGANRLMPKEKSLLSALSGEDGPLTYAFLDQTRKQVGQAMRKATGPFADTESGILKKLYSTLSDDQQIAAEAAGAGDLFKAAKGVVAVRKGLEDDMISLFGKQLDKSIVGDLSGSLAALPKGDTSKMIKMLTAIPENMRQEAVASGLSTAFNISSKNQKLSFTNYANWYEGLLKNKQAHTALMSNLPPEARKQLSDLYRVSKGISSATRERITTGRIMAVQEELRGADNLMARIYDVAKRAAAGVAAEAVTTPIGLSGVGLSAGIASALTKGKTNTIKAADSLISSPEFMEAIRQAGARGPQVAAESLAATRAFREFARSLKNPGLISNPEQWIMTALTSATTDKARQDVEAEAPPPQP
jgi:hypothetical protein